MKSLATTIAFLLSMLAPAFAHARTPRTPTMSPVAARSVTSRPSARTIRQEWKVQRGIATTSTVQTKGPTTEEIADKAAAPTACFGFKTYDKNLLSNREETLCKPLKK